MPHHRHARPRRDRERHVEEDLAIGLVAEIDIAEHHGRRPFRQLGRAGLVLHLEVLRHQAEHLVHVGQRLLDLAIDHAEEIERHVELDQEAVDQHQVADGQRPGRHALRGERHQRSHRRGNDQALADVEQPQRHLVPHRRRLVALQALVVAARLEVLVAEVLHRLVVEQAVDGARVGLRVELVGVLPDLDAPLGDEERVADVGGHRGESDRRKAPVEPREQHRGHQGELEDHRDDRKDQVRQQRGNAPRPALDVARHAAGLPVEVEAQRQVVQMAEHPERHAADGALRDAHEHHVAQLGEQRGHEAQDAVHRQHGRRHGQHGEGRVEVVDDDLHHQRHAYVGELCADQQGEGEADPPAVVPEVGQQPGNRAPVAATRLVQWIGGGRCGVVMGGVGGGHGGIIAHLTPGARPEYYSNVRLNPNPASP